jgi:cobalamin-dependent methionine synthase I
LKPEGITLIAEKINASIPSAGKLFEAGDMAGLQDFARIQDREGADYIDVNVGRRAAEIMAETVKAVQAVTEKPLSIDTPEPRIAEAGLKAYDPAKAGGQKPVLNSISPLRLKMMELYKIQPFKPILMISEREENGRSVPNNTAETIHETGRKMLAAVREYEPDIPDEQCIFDPGIPSLGGDTENMTKVLLDALKRIQEDPEIGGVHVSVGMSNFTNMLPSRCKDGSPVRSPLESAFITKAMPLGLDMIIGSTKRKYRILDADHPAMQCVEDILTMSGLECLTRLREFYA